MAAKNRLARLLKQYESCKITKEELRKILESGVLGRVTGIIGPYVLRYRNDKLIISERAVFYNKSMSHASIEGRNNFSVKVRFAKCLKDIDIVKRTWNKSKGETGKAWNRLIKYNDIKGAHPTINNIITPPKHHFELDQICSFEKGFRIKINRDSLLSADKVVIVIVPFDPIKSRDTHFEMISLTDGDFALTKNQKDLCRKYRRYILYTAVIREIEAGMEWSNTLAVEGGFEIDKKNCSEENVLSWLFFIQRHQTKHHALYCTGERNHAYRHTPVGFVNTKSGFG